MKRFEIEFKQTSYVVKEVRAETLEDAIELAWRWYESCPSTMDVSVELHNAEELT